MKQLILYTPQPTTNNRQLATDNLKSPTCNPQPATILLLLFFFLFSFACNNSTGDYNKPENALDAGREFIESSLKGHFTTAKQYMLQDEDNLYWLDKVSKDYNGFTEQDKNGFSNASINITEVADVSDSITVINYSNSYKKRAQKVKVIKQNGEWLVDFKYTFSGNL